MAKRYTDTDKWKKESWSSWTMKMKVIWIFLCDNCNHAGIWDINFRLISFHVGDQVGMNDLAMFGDKLSALSETKIFIPSFIEFQYGTLNPDNRVHASVLSVLKKEGACMGHASPIQGAKDKDKDKDKDKEGGLGETKKATAVCEFSSEAELIDAIPDQTFERWEKLYSDVAFINREILKAWGYYHDDNPKKEPKSMRGWCSALSSWLERGWKNHVKEIPVNKPQSHREPNSEWIGPRAIKYPSCEEVFAEQEAQKEPSRPLTAEERNEMRKKLIRLAGSVKTIGGI